MGSLRYLSLLFALGQAMVAYAVRPATVTGKLSGYSGTQLTVNYQPYALLAGQEKLEGTVADDGSFRFSLPISGPTRAFLIVHTAPAEERFTVTRGDGRDTTMTTKTNRSQLIYLYLVPGDRQHVVAEATDVRNSLSITGKNGASSLYLNEEDWRFNQYRDKHLKNYFGYVNYSPERYTAYVAEREAERLAFLADFAGKHRLAKQLRHVSLQQIRGDAVMARLLYPSMRASYREDGFEAQPDYYDFLPAVELDYAKTDKGIAYFYFLDYYLKESHRHSGSEKEFFDWVASRLGGRSLYEYYAFALGGNFKKRLYERFGPGSPYPDLAKLVKAKYQHLEGMLEGSPAPAVVLQDTTGTDIPLAQLQGKYLYLDFWATWCGPCIAEIPALESLQHDYAERNVAFVSISVDKPREKQKWKDFVGERQLQGIQVWVDETNARTFTETFNIKQIPRFVLLDPEGRIVDANAPRPSDDRVRKLLDGALDGGR